MNPVVEPLSEKVSQITSAIVSNNERLIRMESVLDLIETRVRQHKEAGKDILNE